MLLASGLALSAVPPVLYSAWLGGLTIPLSVVAAISLSGAAVAWGTMRRISRPLIPVSSGRFEGREAITKDVLDSLPDPVIETDREGRIVFVNRAALLATGYKAEDAVGKPCSNFLPAGCARPPGALPGHSGHSGQDAFEIPLSMKDGSTRFFEFKSVRLGDGPDDRSICIGRDSDERKRLLDELTSAKKQEAAASTKLKKTISDLEEFALLAIRRELKMQELRERFVRLKEEHEINKEFPG